MAENRKGNGDEDGVETTQVLIGDDGTENGRGVTPEGVEGRDTEGSTLTHTQSSGLTLEAGVPTSGLTWGEWALDVVGVCRWTVSDRVPHDPVHVGRNVHRTEQP